MVAAPRPGTSRRDHLLAGVASLAVLLAGCTSFTRVVPPPVVGTAPCDTAAAVYSRSYFQARYQGTAIASMIVGGPVLAGAVMSQSQEVDRARQRRESGSFERLLGDFDVVSHVDHEAGTALRQSRYFAFNLARDPAAAGAIVADVRALEASTPPPRPVSPTISAGCVAAFKVTYGLGARAGAEQLGFRKSYRPFVHVVGAVYRAAGKEALWRDAVIAFGPVRYLGGGADADRIPSGELAEGLRVATGDALSLLVRSLNGAPIAERAMLVDGNDSDLAF